jgi:sulfite reductase (ferredoxin)
LLPDGNGGTSPGFQVHLGGGLVTKDRDEAGLGRTVRGLKVTAEELPDYVERLVRRYDADKDGDETFASWAHRAEEEALQ